MVCGGAKFFGSALLIQCTVFASPRALFHYVGKCLQGSVRVQLVSSWTSCLPSRRSDVITTFFLAVVVYRRLDITSNWWGASRHFSWTGSTVTATSHGLVACKVEDLPPSPRLLFPSWYTIKWWLQLETTSKCKPEVQTSTTLCSYSIVHVLKTQTPARNLVISSEHWASECWMSFQKINFYNCH